MFPTAPTHRTIQLKPGSHQGDNDDELRHSLGKITVLQRVQPNDGEDREPDKEHSYADAYYRQRQRELLEKHRHPRGKEHDGTKRCQDEGIRLHLPRG